MAHCRLTVTMDAHGRFTADPGGPGSPIVGRGGSALEAIGDFAVQSELLDVRCDPPELVDTKYRLNPKVNAAKLELIGCARRD